jgi:hypothetical protein
VARAMLPGRPAADHDHVVLGAHVANRNSYRPRAQPLTS